MKNILNLIKAAVIWIFSNKDVSIKYILMGLEVAKIAAKVSPTSKDDAGIAYIAKTVHAAAEHLDDQKTRKLAKELTKSQGVLEGLTIGYKFKTKRITADIGAFKAEYNPKDGSINFGSSINV